MLLRTLASAVALTSPPPRRATPRPQSSQVQLWVVKVHGGDLKPYNVRAATTGAGALPSQQTEQALAM